MHRGMLSDYFEGVAVKKLRSVETSPDSSNQHEFNGTAALRGIFGDADREKIPTRFIWLGSEQEGIASDSTIKWYDSRRNHPTRTEYRLYYPDNAVSEMMEAGDTVFVALRKNGEGMIIVTPSETTIQSQLFWLFGLENQPEQEFSSHAIHGDQDTQIDFAARYILDELGIELEGSEDGQLDRLIEPYGLTFPKTSEFSKLAQDSLPDISPEGDDPDEVLMAWLDREEMLFRRLERRIVSDRLSAGFMQQTGADVDGFIAFSLSVQNRRKSRAGHALENHLESIFRARSISYSRGANTENRHKPDFLFPSIAAYRDYCFPSSELRMLGSKSTLKDRWRQVLTEAQRIDIKHLLTLEPAISEHQTDQMKSEQLQLVVPSRIQSTYRPNQRAWLLSLSNFIDCVKSG
ncbi:MAG: restriction endonuclease [Gammaproteobacteria bacterium]|nr:restriction endonuclease [Gammaproteobacteria bacterium]